MTAKSSRDDISRALKSIDRAWRAVRSALKASEMTAAAERAASAAAAVAQQPLSVRADAETYKETGKIVALDNSDLLFIDDDDDDEVTLNVDTDIFARVMDEAADRLESQAHSWNEQAHQLESAAHEVDEDKERLRREYDLLCETAQDGERYLDRLSRWEAAIAQHADADDVHERLEHAKDKSAELWGEVGPKRRWADEVLSEAAQKCSDSEIVSVLGGLITPHWGVRMAL